MHWTYALAFYLLFWWLSLFCVLPFGVRTNEEVGLEHGRGHAESAPHSFSFGKVALRTTIVSIILFAIYYLIYTSGVISPAMLDWTGRSQAAG